MIPRNYTRSQCAEKHDKLGWTAGFSFPCGDTVFGVRTNDESMLEVLRAALPVEITTFSDQTDVGTLYSFRRGGLKAKRGQRDFHLVYRDWNRMERTHDLEQALHSFKMLILDGVHGYNQKVQILYPGSLITLDGKDTVLMGEGYLEITDQLAQTHPVQSREFVRFDVSGQVAPCPLQGEKLQSAPELRPVASVLRLCEGTEERMLTPGEAVVRTISLARGTDNPKTMLSLLGHLFKQVPVKDIPRASLQGPELLTNLARLA